jgi:regulator of nucleoside diphosphate kinase
MPPFEGVFMQIDTTRERTLTQLDHVRLTRLLAQSAAQQSGHTASTAQALHELLEWSHVVQSRAVDAEVVTMYSLLLLRERPSGEMRKLVVCYPHDADAAAGFISVLSPLGGSLLGLRVGEVARWRGPRGEEHSAEIVELLFQPEASGDYAT